MKKTLILSLIIIVTIGLIYGLILYVGIQGFLFAWMLNLILMMCVYTFTETLKSPFNASYFDDKKWENKGKIYELFGINSFRKLLVLIGWEKLNKKTNPVENESKSLQLLHYRTKQSELGHLIILFIVLGFTIFVGVEYGIIESLWLLSLNILINLYPIFLQRYNRPRFERAITLSKYKESKLTTK